MNTIQPKPATERRNVFALFAGVKSKAMLLGLGVFALQSSAKSQELQGLYGLQNNISISGASPLDTDPAFYHLNGATGELWAKNNDGMWVKTPYNLKGDDGQDGSAGRGITGATINGSNHLIVTYSDNTTTDAGSVSANLATVAVSGSYADLSNKPTIPAAQIQSDWTQGNSVSLDYIKNKPTLGSAALSSASAFATSSQGSKADSAVQPGSLATVATTGSYSDLTGRPTIPPAQVNSDWSASSGVAQILNKPSLASVATTGVYNDLTGKPTLSTAASSGSYLDLTNRPTIPAAQVNSDWNAASGVAQILNKPTLSTVATSGSYNDLANKPSIPSAQVNSDWNAVSGIAQILNKPTLGTASLQNSTAFATAAQGAKADTALQTQVQSDWSAVSGSAFILNKPTLGTAASQASTSFASSAQGTKADSAVQTSTAPLVVTGTNIALSPATTSTAGSLSAADKTSLDALVAAKKITLVGDYTISDNILVSLALGMKRVTVTATGVTTSDRIMVILRSAPSAGCEILNCYVSAANTVNIGVLQPAVGVLTAYTIPIAVYKIN